MAPLIEPAGLRCACGDTQGFESRCEDEFALTASLVEAIRRTVGMLVGVALAHSLYSAAER